MPRSHVNLVRLAAAGLQPDESVTLDTPFFAEVAPCLDNPLVAGRLAAAQALDVALDCGFRRRQRHELVRLRLLADARVPHRFVLVDRRR